MQRQYLFTSERLGFRDWAENDLKPMHIINSNPLVMQYFPNIEPYEKTEAFITRAKKEYLERQYCYFAVETLHEKEFIGFIGLSYMDFEADFTPCINIGWRLSPQHWNKGYATEGASKCLEYGFDHIKLKKIIAIAPIINLPSIKVMEKIGMKHINNFQHPFLKDYTSLETCAYYEITPTKN